MDRRNFTLGAGTLLLIGCSMGQSQANAEQTSDSRSTWAENALAQLEQEAGGRLGAFVLDSATGRNFGLRQGERFGMCSTFKLSLAAYLLHEADAGRIMLDEVIPYSRTDLMSVSPITTGNLARGGMTIGALAEATQITSDNAAANLLLKRIGGPQIITQFWRELGDPISRLDRFEPELNLVPPGEQRDTITPEGIARSVAKFAAGPVLSPNSQARLQDWMARTETGLRRIRAALPADWRGGDKTGTGSSKGQPNKYNDIALLYPPTGKGPLVVVGFYEAKDYYDGMRAEDEAVLKRLGEIVVQWAS